ncbi:AAA family ATPase [Endozoicomonas sp. 8E]|uniref:AAA family ATPase n=1 Tax=Endozoicomonas sp. 8E TaxID=3035692 RepID=UPI0029390990|nr:AAA family ATPase [Endozoicomonas sp. 8E]WOG29168.1 AAA family ATPase [Endozoicomonas sp. 8E]
MIITSLKLKNWRNFRDAEINLAQVSYIVGPNASGKSNLLDVFRFIRDICRADGGGLQKAVKDRGGITRLRCLHHRRDTEVKIEVSMSEGGQSDAASWKYVLAFKTEGKGAQRIMISSEEVWKNGKRILNRPDKDDKKDALLLTETHLEQTRANKEFRSIVTSFSEVTYLHLVPQLLKYADHIGGNRLENDPFGQGFLERLARTPKKTRDSRLKKIGDALSIAVPRFKGLRYIQNERGQPHLEAQYEHHRPNAGWQSEEHFSDGTLRLLGILWSLLEGKGVLLLEEPELSLHNAVVEQIPLMIDRVQRRAKTRRRQVIISTHSEAILNNEGIDPKSVIILEPGREGSQIRTVSKAENKALEAGLTVSEVILPKTRPANVQQLGA